MDTAIVPALHQQAGLDAADVNAAVRSAQNRFIVSVADAAADASDAASQFLTAAVFALDTTNAVSFASDIEYCYDRDIPWASCTLHGKLILGDDVVADATWDASWTNGRFEHARPFLTVSITGRKGLLGRFGITSRTVVATAAELAAALAVNAK